MRSIPRLITTSMRILSFLWACIVASVLRAAAQEPPSFFARGHISTTSKNPKMAFATVPSPFEVTVTGCTWMINYPVASGDKAQFAARTVEFDGTNCISRELFSANPWAKGVQNSAAGHVEGGVVPDPNSPMYTGYIWMALCSGCYFKTNSPGRAAPVWTLNPLVQSERYYPAAIWELAGKPPHTPAKITYYLDDTVNFQSPTFAEDLRVIVKEALPPRISDRRLWARLEVISYISNLDGLDIPKEFECEVFNSVPPGTPSGTQPGRAYSIRCVVDEAGLVAPGAKPAEGRFKNAKFVVDDYRAGIGNSEGRIPVQYNNIGGSAAQTNTDVWLVAEARAKSMAADPPPAPKRPDGLRLLFIAAVCTISTVVIAIILASKNKVKSKVIS